MLTSLHIPQDACFQQALSLKKTLNVLPLLRHKATVLSLYVITVVKTCPCLPVRVLLLTVASFSWNTSNYTSLSLSGQISLLKQSLELQLSQSQSALQQLQSQFNQERELLSQQLKGKLAYAPVHQQ